MFTASLAALFACAGPAMAQVATRNLAAPSCVMFPSTFPAMRRRIGISK
jgi:hypothetical protein